MAPLVAALMKAGLGLLGNAVLAKGKEVVEEKLGVNLEAMTQSPDGLIRLKELEIEHERDLNDFVLAKREQELKADQMAYTDIADARKRDTAFLAAGKRNYRADAMFVLALVVVVWLVYIVWKDQSINEYVKGIFTLVLGRFLGYVDNIYNYEFGTTRINRSKDTTIERLSKGRDE
jgi:hypothetical protein